MYLFSCSDSSDCPLTRPSSSGPQPLSGRPCNPRVINEYSPSSRSRIVAGRGKLNPISSRDQIKVFTSVCHIVVSHVNFVVLQFNSTVYSGGLMTDLDCPWHFYMVFRTLTVRAWPMLHLADCSDGRLFRCSEKPMLRPMLSVADVECCRLSTE